MSGPTHDSRSRRDDAQNTPRPRTERRIENAGNARRVPEDILSLQRASGNAAVSRLIAPPGADHSADGHSTLAQVQREPAPQGSDVETEFSNKLKDWRTHANTGVGEAVHGTLEKKIADATSFNSDAWTGGILGNLIWALASFAAGWEAFIISVAGIAVGAAAGGPKSQAATTPVADIEEALQKQLDVVQSGAGDAVKAMSNRFQAQGRALTLPAALNEAFAKDQLTAGSSADLNPERIRAAYRNSALQLFATIAAEVDPIGTDVDITGPDAFVSRTTKARLIYLADFGYAIAHRPQHAHAEWDFMQFVSPEMVGAAKVKAMSSGEGPIPVVDIGAVSGMPSPFAVALPVALAPYARLVYIRQLGYAVVREPDMSFIDFVPSEQTDAALRNAASSGDGPIQVLDAGAVNNLPKPTVVPLPVPPPPTGARR